MNVRSQPVVENVPARQHLCDLAISSHVRICIDMLDAWVKEDISPIAAVALAEELLHVESSANASCLTVSHGGRMLLKDVCVVTYSFDHDIMHQPS